MWKRTFAIITSVSLLGICSTVLIHGMAATTVVSSVMRVLAPAGGVTDLTSLVHGMKNSAETLSLGLPERVFICADGTTEMLMAAPAKISAEGCLNKAKFPPQARVRIEIPNYSPKLSLVVEYSGLWIIRWSILTSIILSGLAIWSDSAIRRRIGQKQQLQVAASIEKMVAQVVHDVRSPLAALNAVASDLHFLPEDARTIIKNAVSRINDITNDLAKKNPFFKNKQNKRIYSAPKSEYSNVSLVTLINSVLSEKRLQFLARKDLSINFKIESSAYDYFSIINASDLKRVISNLLNNSIESIAAIGAVDVSIGSIDQNQVQISIKDTGKGIPEEILSKLGGYRETYNKKGGSGLGLYHAQRTITAFGGSMKIHSTQSSGTMIVISLPLATPPNWFLSRIILDADFEIFVVDDDPLIHQIWKMRFDSISKKAGLSSYRSFSSPEELYKFMDIHKTDSTPRLFLVDYEFANKTETGLQLIRNLNIESESILVTNRSEEISIVKDCEQLGVKVVPKMLAGLVPISIRSNERNIRETMGERLP